MICKYFLPSCGLYFCFLDGVICSIKYFNFKFLFNFSFVTCGFFFFYFVCKALSNSRWQRLPSRFSLKSVVVLPHTFRSMIYSELISECKEIIQLHSSARGCAIVMSPFIAKTFMSPLNCLAVLLFYFFSNNLWIVTISSLLMFGKCTSEVIWARAFLWAKFLN